jgi:flagellar protein FlaG
MDIRTVNSGPQSGNFAADATASAPVRPAVAQTFAAEPTVPAALVQQPASVMAPGQLKQALKDINEAMRSMSSNLEFSVDEDSERPIVKVIDVQTGDVIRQIPSKEALEISKALDKVQGLLVRQQA